MFKRSQMDSSVVTLVINCLCFAAYEYLAEFTKACTIFTPLLFKTGFRLLASFSISMASLVEFVTRNQTYNQSATIAPE